MTKNFRLTNFQTIGSTVATVFGLVLLVTACKSEAQGGKAKATGWTLVKRSPASASRDGSQCVVEIGSFRGPDGNVKLSAFRGRDIGGFTIDWGTPIDFRGIPRIVALTIGQEQFPANIDYSEDPSATALHVINKNGFWISRYMQGAATIWIESKALGHPLVFNTGDLTKAGIALDECGEAIDAEAKADVARRREKMNADIWGEDKSQRPPFAQ